MTIAAFLLYTTEFFTAPLFITIIVILAILQMLIQLFLFLHLGSEGKPHWNSLLFLFMLIVVGIIVGGSLWIMKDLNSRTMPSGEEMNRYMLKQEALSHDKHH
jgi:cytochrome o ubiquinol oxidase operon protein cyoD